MTDLAAMFDAHVQVTGSDQEAATLLDQGRPKNELFD